MENSSIKSLTKPRLLLLLLSLLIASATIFGNLLIATRKKIIVDSVNRNFFKRISLEKIFYLPPNFIIVKSLTVSEGDAPGDKKIFSVPLLIYASLWSNLSGAAIYSFLRLPA